MGRAVRAGKARVRLNPIKHGVLAQTPVIPLVEKAEDWERLRSGLHEYWDVRGTQEQALVERLAVLLIPAFS